MADEPRRVKIPVDNQKSVEVNLTPTTPQVFAYRMWSRAPGETTWTRIHEGTTEDGKPEQKKLGPFVENSVLAYWIGVGGTPGSSFEIVVTFAQDGKVVKGGAVVESGHTSDKGVALRRTLVDVL
jgi:hypothetical protein